MRHFSAAQHPLQQFAMMVAVVDAALLNEPHEEK